MVSFVFRSVTVSDYRAFLFCSVGFHRCPESSALNSLYTRFQCTMVYTSILICVYIGQWEEFGMHVEGVVYPYPHTAVHLIFIDRIHFWVRNEANFSTAKLLNAACEYVRLFAG